MLVKNSKSAKLKYKWDYKSNKAVPKPEEHDIAEKIMSALFIGFMVPALLTSPFGLYAIVQGAARYYFKKSGFNREVKRLQKRGYVALTKTDKGWMMKLLPKGLVYQKRIEIKHMRLPHPKAWDGKWRLFISDIPEELRNARNMIRRKLKSLGCYNIQRSTFVYPHDCQKELEALAEYYKVTKFVLFAEVSYLDMNRELRKFFNV